MKTTTSNLALASFITLLSSTALYSCDNDDDTQTPQDITESLIAVDGFGTASTTDEKYTIKLYSDGSTLRKGYNKIYVAAHDAEGNIATDFEFIAISPLMDMGTMKHSTPIGSISATDGAAGTWVAFLMKGEWQINVTYKTGDGTKETATFTGEVDDSNSGERTIASFKHGEQTYYATLADANALKDGSNNVKAYINKKGEDAEKPYELADEEFIIAIDPRMPDMGNHTSTGNTDLTLADGEYAGTLNLSMTGYWKINVIIKDKDGNVVAGNAVSDEEGASSIYWEVTI